LQQRRRLRYGPELPTALGAGRGVRRVAGEQVAAGGVEAVQVDEPVLRRRWWRAPVAQWRHERLRGSVV
jgi:hypothetical protein